MTFEMYRDAASEWRWRLKSDNGKVIATSGEGYKNKGDCSSIISKIRLDAKDAAILDLKDA